MESAAHFSMLAQITAGDVKKSDCRFVTDAESSQLWDRLAEQVAALKKQGMIIDAPNEIP